MKHGSLSFLLTGCMFITILLGLCLLLPSVNSETLIVHKELGYHSVQAAIDDAHPGDKIQILNGTYDETLFVNKSLHLCGNASDRAILNAEAKILLTITASNVTVHDFIFTNASKGIVLNQSCFCRIYNNTFTNLDVGICTLDNSTENIFHKNNFIANNNSAVDTFNNTWNNSTIGNYWSNYTGNDTNNDGIGDEPYFISNGINQDFLPAIYPLSRIPLAKFTFSPSTPSTKDPIEFISLSYDTDGFIESWFWDFGDNNSSSQMNPTHQFQSSGTYTVTLTVTDNVGVNNTTTKTIKILNVPPSASFSFTPKKPTDTQQVSFKDSSTDIDGVIQNWTWDFGDNTTSYEQNPSHLFAEDKTYIVQLIVEDNHGDNDSYSQSITVSNVAPSARFTVTFSNVTAYINQPVFFHDTSIDPDGRIVSREWYFGDNSDSSEKNPSHTYTQKGSFTVSLTVEDDDGDTATKTQRITVSDTMQDDQVDAEFSIFDIVIVVFLVVIIILVIVLSKIYG
ncbi:MAG: PKD domain-containing protein [Candidatus Thermoplasmatota archaeon]|nr:PKD domain-containing protein [Candidatus Thermoplasmatota archaeon]